MLYPFTFQPILKQRVWGGRELERLYGKPLPPAVPIGESWEISDRPGDVSVIANGPLAGKGLDWLMENHAAALLGNARSQRGRFPLLLKILDAREKLSLQVHPPASMAAALGGEPKTEMWYVAQAAPDAELFVGLKRGVSRAEFEQRITAGTVAQCFHRLSVQAGDTMFLPSGRVHALGAGLVIFEIQQNSDTTYRVFDWNRVGLDGKPRELHVPQSLASIDFNDYEPSLLPRAVSTTGAGTVRPLVNDPLFSVEAQEVRADATVPLRAGKLQIIAVLTGRVQIGDGAGALTLVPGQFCLIPASLKQVTLRTQAPASFLRVEA